MSSEEVDHSRWEEQHEDASDKAKSFIPFSPPLFPGCLRKKDNKQQFDKFLNV